MNWFKFCGIFTQIAENHQENTIKREQKVQEYGMHNSGSTVGKKINTAGECSGQCAYQAKDTD